MKTHEEIQEELDKGVTQKLKTLKDAMVELIKKSAEFEESFIFEKLQDYMDFSNGKATWTSNVRLRMLEISEAIENEKQRQKEKAIKWVKDYYEKNGTIPDMWKEFHNITEEDLK